MAGDGVAEMEKSMGGTGFFFFGGGMGAKGRMDISSALEIPISHSHFDIRKAVGNTSVDTGRARDIKECWL